MSIQKFNQSLLNLENLLKQKLADFEKNDLSNENIVLKEQLAKNQEEYQHLKLTSQEVITELNNSIQVIEEYFKNKMPTIKILNRDYEVACGPGEEKRLEQLASSLNAKLSQNAKSFRGANDATLLLLTALMLEDQNQELQQSVNLLTSQVNTSLDQILEDAAEKINKLAKLL